MPEFNYTEFNLDYSKRIPLEDTSFKIILKFYGKTDKTKVLVVKSTFIHLIDNVFDIEVTSSLYFDHNSQQWNF